MRRTHENSDVSNTLDEIYLVLNWKKVIILYIFQVNCLLALYMTEQEILVLTTYAQKALFKRWCILVWAFLFFLTLCMREAKAQARPGL